MRVFTTHKEKAWTVQSNKEKLSEQSRRATIAAAQAIWFGIWEIHDK